MLPEKYMGAVMFGNGCSGIIMNLLKILILSVLPGGDENIFKNELIFCTLAAIILVFCSIGFSVLQNNKFYLHYKNKADNKNNEESAVLDED
jgi:hypothetical protein